MTIKCVREYNGHDTLLYAMNLPGAYARGASLEIAMDDGSCIGSAPSEARHPAAFFILCTRG